MFKPNDLVVQNSKYTLEDLLGNLNLRFQKLIDSGWYTDWHKDRIYLQVARSSEPNFYDGILSLRTELVDAYLAAGWGKAIIKTSGEDGERDGILSVRLFKENENESWSKSTKDNLNNLLTLISTKEVPEADKNLADQVYYLLNSSYVLLHNKDTGYDPAEGMKKPVNPIKENLLDTVGDIKNALISMNIQRSQQEQFDVICKSLASIEKITDSI